MGLNTWSPVCETSAQSIQPPRLVSHSKPNCYVCKSNKRKKDQKHFLNVFNESKLHIYGAQMWKPVFFLNI